MKIERYLIRGSNRSNYSPYAIVKGYSKAINTLKCLGDSVGSTR